MPVSPSSTSSLVLAPPRGGKRGSAAARTPSPDDRVTVHTASQITPAFNRDVKRLARKHRDMKPLKHVMNLIIDDSAASKSQLHRRHNAHRLTGNWSDTIECHIDNNPDWLLLWARTDDMVAFLRTGTHDELFG